MPVPDDARFSLRYAAPLRPFLTAVGMGPRASGVRVDAEVIEVRMGWAFRARIPRSAVRDVRPHRGPVLSWGVHGWHGRWLVNGSSRGVLRLTVEPACPALVCGVPVRLRDLAVSVERPDDLLAAISDPTTRPDVPAAAPEFTTDEEGRR
ncbi:hypothetical protein ACQEVB_39020 [Pseudonocardia sp. CA-107938]|uniref:hypothetical protein n=1 Tax=Pseudonocardia sp. CA-107938 TaxID=3240021 RepID=UPI003D909EDE